MASSVSDDLFSRALDHHRAGRLGDAEAGYRQALESEPDAPRILHQLGLLALQTNRPTLALSWLERACALNAESDDSRRLLAQAFVAAGQRESALACLRSRTEVQPLSAEAWIDYAALCQQSFHVPEAIRAYREALRLQPSHAALHANVGALLRLSGAPEAARAALEQAVQLDPSLAPAHATLGRVWQDLGLLAAAEQAFLRARSLAPGLISVHLDLGNLLLVSGRNEDAVTRFAEAVTLHPDQPDLLVSLGTALRAVGRSDEAVAVLQRAVSLAPGLAAAHNNLANARLDQGRPADAAVSFRHALAAAPAEASYHSNLILALHYADAPASVLHETFIEWNRRVPPAPPSALAPTPARRARLRTDRLRVGLVSPDLRDHSVGRFLLGLLAQGSAAGLEWVAYSDAVREDGLSARLKRDTSLWRPIAGRSDADVASWIAADGIDVLVDLSLHTSGNRLPLFQRRPAPVQISYLGYPGGTGVAAIPYRLTDHLLEDPGAEPALFPEIPIVLESPYWCYTPPENAPPIGPRATAPLQLGCLGNPGKVTPAVLDAWADILRRLPHARFLLHATSADQRRTILERWSRQGIASERVSFVGRLPFSDYLGLCAHIDLLLDTFPFNGATTTCDALWMGTPVITCAGLHPFSRSGASLLDAAGLAEAIAYSVNDYVERVVTLANTPELLRELRLSLRGRLLASRLLDAPAFARAFAHALGSRI